MPPSRVVLFRHGEKSYINPEDGLTQKGQIRANLLSDLLIERYPLMKAIYAAGVGPGDESNRKIQTVAPLVAKMIFLNPEIAVNTKYLKYEYKQVVDEILSTSSYMNRTVLICWTHNTLPALAKAFQIPRIPPIWPEHRYDVLWEIDLYQKKLTQIPQLLLPGDRLEPILL